MVPSTTYSKIVIPPLSSKRSSIPFDLLHLGLGWSGSYNRKGAKPSLRERIYIKLLKWIFNGVIYFIRLRIKKDWRRTDLSSLSRKDFVGRYKKLLMALVKTNNGIKELDSYESDHFGLKSSFISSMKRIRDLIISILEEMERYHKNEMPEDRNFKSISLLEHVVEKPPSHKYAL